MNKKYRTQAITLLSISALLSPSIYFLFFGGNSTDPTDQYIRLFNYIFLPLPALASLFCFAIGLARLHAAKARPNVGDDGVGIKEEYRHKKSDLVALILVTGLLAIIGLAMLLFIIHLFRLEGGMALFIVSGIVPLAVLVFTIVMIPLNIRSILKHRTAISPDEHRL